MPDKFLLKQSPELFADCYEAGKEWGAKHALPATPRKIVLSGVGYAALAGECLQALTMDCASLPIVISRDFAVPAFVDPGALVLCLAETGTEEETVYAVSDALDRGASVWVMTGGGHLRDIAAGQNLPCVVLPADAAHPSAILGALFFVLWGALQTALPVAAAVLPQAAETDTLETFGLLRRQRDFLQPEITAARNPARQLASALQGVLPLILATNGITAAAAHYWKTQFRAAGKRAARSDFSAARAEDFVAEIDPGAAVVVLRDRRLDSLPAERIRQAQSAAIAAMPDIVWHEIYADGPSPLARLFTTLALGDWTAAYLDGR